MKYLFSLIVLLSFITPSKASTYYFSSVSGDDLRTSAQAQDSTTPWQTLDKLNSLYYIFQPGDSVLFKGDEKFYGQIGIGKSGTLGNPIYYGAYGAGANPTISAFSTISNWTPLNENVYYASLDVPNLNMVTIDNAVKGMGRYPNTGYLNYESHTNNTSITDNQLSADTNWTGAEVVIRKYRWILDRQTITAQSGGTLTYNALNTHGNNSNYSPLDGNGYFIQNALNTLDQYGEWYYDIPSKRLYVYFGGDDPNTHIVKASTIDRNFTVNSQTFITFDNLNFEGANTNGGYLIGANNVTINNCNITAQGGNGLYGGDVFNITVNGGTITNALNNGIFIEYQGANTTVNNVTLSNIGTIAGEGMSGDGSQEGISINGNNTIITNCSVIRAGYNGISFSGDDALIEHNYVDSFCLVKDDGGGIYTYVGERAMIKNNVVLNAIGAYAGAEWAYWEPFGKAVGIYLDNGVANHNAIVSGNTIAHGEWGGIFINNNGGNTITNNTIFDLAQQLLLIEYSAGAVRNTTITNNQFIARTTTQKAFYNQMYVNESPSLFGSIDSNYYARPISDSFSIQTAIDGNTVTQRTLAGWQTFSGGDAHSLKSPITITDLNNIRLEYNATSSNKTIILDSNYIDVTGKLYQGTVTLNPYTSVVLLKDTTIINQLLSANAGPDQTILLPSSSITLAGSGNNLNGTIASSLWTQMAGHAATIISPNSMSSLVTGLVQGSYKFKLMVTDNNGATGIDSMQITVSQNILPLTLLKFKAQLISDKSSLTWGTADEKDVSGFDIERMTANTWIKIGFVPSLNSALDNYSFYDNTPVVGSNFYRLKMVDIDGAFTYSNIVTVELKPNKNIIYQNVPNPFNNTTTIRYKIVDKALVKVIVYNELGIQIAILANEIKQPGDYQVQWNAANIASGNYFYTVIIGNDVTTRKMLKIN